MRMLDFGRVVFALAFAALGALTIAMPGMAAHWLLIPTSLAWHDALAMLLCALLIAACVALLVPQTARPASLALAALLLVPLALKIPGVAAHPLVEVVWEDICQDVIYVAGAWTIFSLLPRDIGALGKIASVRAGRIAFGLALLPIGLSHFFYLDLTAPIIPSWIPFHVPLAYLTGAAHFAAGIAILFGVLPRLAATLEAVMVSLFTVLVWPPIVMAAPQNQFRLTEICASAAIAGAAWAVAASFRMPMLSGWPATRSRAAA